MLLITITCGYILALHTVLSSLLRATRKTILKPVMTARGVRGLHKARLSVIFCAMLDKISHVLLGR